MVSVLALLAPVVLMVIAQPAQAASSKACTDGGYELVNLTSGAVVASARTGEVQTTVAAAALGGSFLVRGRYNEYKVRASDFALFDYAFTGAANPLDRTGGVRTPVFAGKVPDHRGLTLTSGISVDLDEEDLVIGRTGTGLSMKIPSKDCAQGGIQMEPERADATRTRIVHTLASTGGALQPFYFDNPNFRPGSASSSARAAPARPAPRVSSASR